MWFHKTTIFSFFKMGLRKKVIGDLYLASSLVFIFLGFLYAGILIQPVYGLIFLVIGLIVALLGVVTKKTLILKESKRPKGKK